MSAPHHLWSGDWERESEEAARRRRAAAPLPEPDEPAALPAAPATRPPRRRINRQRWRMVAIALGVAVVVVGSAFGLSALFGSGSKPANNVGEPGWLGVRLGVLPSGRVVVTGFEPGSPAIAAGMRAGDTITEVQSRPVAAPIDVVLAVDALQAGDTIELGALHGSTAYTTRVRLRTRPRGSP